MHQVNGAGGQKTYEEDEEESDGLHADSTVQFVVDQECREVVSDQLNALLKPDEIQKLLERRSLFSRTALSYKTHNVDQVP